MDKTKFSVAMSVYKNDNAEHFARALRSITEEQTVKPDEIVLVVDGPVGDDVNAVIEDFSSKCGIFKVIRLEQNGGLGNALKLAVENASFELIARMDSDDVSVPDRFEQQIKFMTENDVDILGGNISEFIDEEGNVVAHRNVPLTNDEIYEYLKVRCPLNHVSVMFKKNAVIAAGNYIDQYCNEDYYLWIRMAENKAIMANTGTVLVNVRVGKDMYNRRGGRKYFKSEKALQKYMRRKKIISFATYLSNVTKRFIVQVLLPNRLRGWVFKKFARK